MIRNLARDTLFRPRLAARALRDWTLSVATVTEAALLLACLSTLSKYLLLRYLTSLNFEEDVVVTHEAYDYDARQAEISKATPATREVDLV